MKQLIALLLILPLLTASCDTDDDSPIVGKQANLVGNWKVTRVWTIEYDDGSNEIVDNIANTFLELQADNSGRETNPFFTDNPIRWYYQTSPEIVILTEQLGTTFQSQFARVFNVVKNNSNEHVWTTTFPAVDTARIEIGTTTDTWTLTPL